MSITFRKDKQAEPEMAGLRLTTLRLYHDEYYG
jgi:hypothetical protein